MQHISLPKCVSPDLPIPTKGNHPSAMLDEQSIPCSHLRTQSGHDDSTCCGRPQLRTNRCAAFSRCPSHGTHDLQRPVHGPLGTGVSHQRHGQRPRQQSAHAALRAHAHHTKH